MMDLQGSKCFLLIAAGKEEHEGLAQALSLIKDVIIQVDTQVSLYEKEARLREIVSKVEPKSLGKIKDGRVFRKEDLSQGRRKLLYEGMVNWKAASGRLKGIMRAIIPMHKYGAHQGISFIFPQKRFATVFPENAKASKYIFSSIFIFFAPLRGFIYISLFGAQLKFVILLLQRF